MNKTRTVKRCRSCRRRLFPWGSERICVNCTLIVPTMPPAGARTLARTARPVRKAAA